MFRAPWLLYQLYSRLGQAEILPFTFSNSLEVQALPSPWD